MTAELAGELLDSLVFGFDVDIKILSSPGRVLAHLAGEPVGVDVDVQNVMFQQLFARGDEIALVAEGELVVDLAVSVLDVETEVEGVVGQEGTLGALVALPEELDHLLGHLEISRALLF